MKNEVKSKNFKHDRLLKCMWAIYVVHAVHINTRFFYELIIFSLAEFDSLHAKRFTFPKHIELTSKVITQVFADQSRSEIIVYLILVV